MPSSDKELSGRLVDSSIAELRRVLSLADGVARDQLELISNLLAEARRLDRLDPDEVAQLEQDVIERSREVSSGGSTESLRRAALDLLSAGSSVDPGPQAEAVPKRQAELSVEEVHDYLRARFPGARDEVFSVSTIVGGYSKRTTLVDCTLEGERAEIVLRQAPAGRSAGSLEPEFALLKTLTERGIPVPQPLWIEPGDNALGGAFFATRRAAGSNVGDVFGGTDVAVETCMDVATLYARLHVIDAPDVALPVSARVTQDDVAAMIQWQTATLAKKGITIEPVLEAVLEWCHRNIPPQPAKPSVIHGDAAFSNLLVLDGRVTTILDWEAAHLGDAAEELAYLRPTVEPIMGWSGFMAQYTAAGGTEPDPKALHFYTVWSYVWRHIGCLWMAQNFAATGRHASAVAGHVLGPRFLRSAVEAAFGTEKD